MYNHLSKCGTYALVPLSHETPGNLNVNKQTILETLLNFVVKLCVSIINNVTFTKKLLENIILSS